MLRARTRGTRVTKTASDFIRRKIFFSKEDCQNFHSLSTTSIFRYIHKQKRHSSEYIYPRVLTEDAKVDKRNSAVSLRTFS